MEPEIDPISTWKNKERIISAYNRSIRWYIYNHKKHEDQRSNNKQRSLDKLHIWKENEMREIEICKSNLKRIISRDKERGREESKITTFEFEIDLNNNE